MFFLSLAGQLLNGPLAANPPLYGVGLGGLFLHGMMHLATEVGLTPEDKTAVIEAMTKDTRELSGQIASLREKMEIMSIKIGSLNEEMLALRHEIAGLSKEDARIRKKAQADELMELESKLHEARSHILDSGRNLSTILNCARPEHLRAGRIRTVNDFRVAASEVFESVLRMPNPVDDFSTRYGETFGAYRQPNAFQIYVSGLIKINSPALEALGAHAFSIFNRTYLAERYDPARNPDLKVLNDYDPNLLRDWQVYSRRNPESLPNYSVHNTDNPEDILLCGTEIPGSCQKVDGDPKLNQGLVGYLSNGQTRLLAIKDDRDGHLVARRLLRLIPDANGKPTLFLEKLYSSKDDPKLDKELIKEAKQIASWLKCPLTTVGMPADQYEDYPYSLQSHGGAAPYEYVDGANGLVQGPYTIYVVQDLLKPKPSKNP